MNYRIKLFASCVLGAFASFVHAQNLLPEKWKFKTGDNVGWAHPSFNDGDWSEIKPGGNWEGQGYADYDGMAWYRVTVTVPSTLKKEAERSGGFSLKLAKIDDADYAYFNGKQIGKTGEFPPNFIGKYDIERKYDIAASDVLWDKPNVIAVRVFDEKGGGGIYGEPVSFSVKGSEDNIKLDIVMKEPNHIILGTTAANFSLVIKNEMKEALKGKLILTLTSDFKVEIAKQEKEVNVASKKSVTVPFVFKELTPGFYQVTALLESKVGNKKMVFRFGIEPEKIVSPLDTANDFTIYWKRAKRELAGVDPQFKLTLVDSLSKGTRNIYLVEMRSLGNVLIKGWYAVPKKPGKYPAILHVPGYGGYVNLEWMYPGDDMISFGLSVRGHGLSKYDFDPWSDHPYFVDHIYDKDMYVYRGAYMDCRRGIDFLFSRPEVDTSKVVAEGGSQGGALSFATAALNPERVRLCLPHVPFLSDFRDYFKLVAWPAADFMNYMKKQENLTMDQAYATLSYIDIKNLAPWVRCPTFMAIGLLDDVCPPHINFAAYNQLHVKKEYMVYPNRGHGIDSQYHKIKYDWIKKQLGMVKQN